VPVFDQGGTLAPGLNLVRNTSDGTRRSPSVDRLSGVTVNLARSDILQIAAAVADVRLQTTVSARSFDIALGARL